MASAEATFPSSWHRLLRRVWTRRGSAFGIALSFGLALWTCELALTLASAVTRAPADVEAADSLRGVLVTRRSDLNGMESAPVMSETEVRLLREAGGRVPVEAYALSEVSVRAGTVRRSVVAATVTAGYWPLLRITLHRGTPNATDGATPAVISDELWLHLFQRADSAIGSTISVDHRNVLVTGIAPPRFHGLDRDIVELWTPLLPQGHVASPGTSRESFYLSAITRASHDRERAAVFLRALQRSSDAARILKVALRPLSTGRLGSDLLRSRVMPYALALAFATLGLAIVNCILIVLNRLTRDLPELRTRYALGAPHDALIRLQRIDTGVPIVAAGLAVLAMLPWASAWLRVLGVGVPRSFVDPRVALAGIGVGVLVLLVAEAATRVALHGIAHDATLARRTGREHGLERTRTALAAAYIGILSALAVGEFPIVLAYASAAVADSGFQDTRDVLILTVGFPDAHAAPTQAGLLATLHGIQSLPFVAAAGIGTSFPYRRMAVTAVSRAPENVDPRTVQLYRVAGDWIRALGIPVLGGVVPVFSPEAHDRVVLNAALSSAWTPARVPGDCIYLAGDRCSRIDAIVNNTDVLSPGDPAQPIVYAPLESGPLRGTLYFAVRTRGAPEPQQRNALRTLTEMIAPDADIALERFTDIASAPLVPLSRTLYVSLVILGIALALAALGLRAIARLAVSDRRQELGVRAALGATPWRLIRHAVGELGVIAILGCATGSAAGLALMYMASNLMVGVSTSILTGQVLAALIVSGVLCVAGMWPAWRMARQTPIQLLLADASRSA